MSDGKRVDFTTNCQNYPPSLGVKVGPPFQKKFALKISDSGNFDNK